MTMASTTALPTHPARVAIGFLATFLLGLPCTAPALTASGLEVEVVVGGATLREYPARGTTYIEATRGAEYALRLRNRTGQRLAVALSVDGINSIDATSTAASSAAKWVLDPWQEITVSGWQTSQRDARRFVFTTEQDSYGAWLGRPEQLGVIEAVAFRERRLQPIPCVREGTAQNESSGRSKGQPAAPEAGSAAGKLSDSLAATGVGRRVDNPVRRVWLDLEREPSAQVRIRYEYRPQLVALGVLPPPPLPDPLDRRERARGFTDSGFCPDPYRGR
jgi:hypothetical protein